MSDNLSKIRIGDNVFGPRWTAEIVGIIRLPDPLYVVRFGRTDHIRYATVRKGFFGQELVYLIGVHEIRCPRGIPKAESFKYSGARFTRKGEPQEVSYTAAGQTSLKSSGVATIHAFACGADNSLFWWIQFGGHPLILLGTVCDLPEDIKISRNGQVISRTVQD